MPRPRARHLTLRRDVAHLEQLAELALDLRWSWSHESDELWRQLDPELWDLTRNPWVVLQTVSRDRLRAALEDRDFHGLLDEMVEARRNATTAPCWFERHHAKSGLTGVAYFSMEFMLSEALPIYSGGLGNVAGDQLKAASDLGVPVTGIGLLYQRGYFRQVIDGHGDQQVFYPYNDPGQLPVTPLRVRGGDWLRIRIDLPGQPLWLRAWQVQVGRLKLYLLDSNDAANFPPHRGITSELYGGPPQMRLQQEIVLGIGGWRLLEALGERPEVCHLNEGHAALAVLERARAFMREGGQPFDVALAATRAGNVFTTHTPVEAGFDRFAPSLVEEMLGQYASNELGLSRQELLGLGRANPADDGEPFTMAWLATRGSGSVNGVSQLHARVSRRIFQPLFPRWPEAEVPIGAVTNGIHAPSWDSAQADALWTRAVQKERWRGTLEGLEEAIRSLPDDEIWRLRAAGRRALVDDVRFRLARQVAGQGGSREAVEEARRIFDPDVLTLGFARRFAAYKRPTLLLHDRERLLRILGNTEHPAQLIVAGKAHPADVPARSMIREWTAFMRLPAARGRVVFLADHDMALTERLVQGVDLWINTPRRPWEACGTSGMKVLVNGGLNLSERDGWWAEAYAPDVGWALGDGHEHGDDPSWDAAEAEALYDLLEREVVPAFHARNDAGVATHWVRRVRESMARLTPRYSSNRSVRDYTATRYLPAAAAYRERTRDGASRARAIAAWRRRLEESWPGVRFAAVQVGTADGEHVFDLDVELHGLAGDDVVVELYAEAVNGRPRERHAMACSVSAGQPSCMHYHAQVPALRPLEEYTPRVVPSAPDVSVPLELPLVHWAR